MPYTPYYTAWQDSPATATPIISAALNNIEAGLTAVSSPVTVVAAPTGTAATDTANINSAITAWASAGRGGRGLGHHRAGVIRCPLTCPGTH